LTEVIQENVCRPLFSKDIISTRAKRTHSALVQFAGDLLHRSRSLKSNSIVVDSRVKFAIFKPVLCCRLMRDGGEST
jgi:hypothetical protein